MTTADSETTSTRPYLIRALHEWCTDNGLTPHLAVSVDETVQVPQEFVKQGEIVLNVSFDATSVLILGDELIEFKGRFSGTPREIRVPVRQVMAIYARENGQGMSFPISAEKSDISKSELANRPVDKSARALTAKGKEKGTANLASVNSVSDQSSSTIPESTGSPETRGPRPTLTRIK
jgi:stringent starvation protein B